jgi:integrase
MEEKIIDFLKNKSKKITESSIKTYISNLRKLNDNKEIKNLNYLKDPEKILNKIKDFKETTQRNYIISICAILKEFDGKKTYDKYYDILKKMNKNYEDKQKKNEMTETQKKNFIEWDEVIKKQKELENKVREFKPSDKITEDKYNILLDFVLISLYTLIPPRRNKDYLEMRVVNDKKEAEDNKYNYYVIDDNEMIFNNYKTSNTEGGLKIEVPTELQKILLYYYNIGCKLNKGDKENNYLLKKYNGTRLDKMNSITLRLNKIFGKNISSSMLRHIYLSSKYGNTLDDMKKDSKMMSHNIEMQKDYIKNK